MTAEKKSPGVTLTIDGKSVTAAPNERVLEVINRAGFNVPHFCYHPKLSAPGVCRMCLIEVEGSRKLEISCSLPVRDGMVIRTQSPKVLEGRQFVMEFTLVNHPLDCPICDQAGECWLQEYYMAHDRMPSRMQEDKVHKDKAVVVGPRVVLDQERCILCTRCVRFCDEITHTSELGIFNRGDQSILDVAPGKELNNAYSENVVDICPVGALTSRDFRFDGRVWFLKESDSICPGCARGCNTVLHHRDNVIRRILPRVNEEVNSHWMCDAGRDIHTWVHAQNRLLKPRVLKNGVSKEVAWFEAYDQAMAKIQGALQEKVEIVGMLSVRSSNEENRALAQFIKTHFAQVSLTHDDLTPKRWQGDQLLKVDDQNPNTRGAMAVAQEIGGVLTTQSLIEKLLQDKVTGLLILNQDLLETPDLALQEKLREALKRLKFLMVFSTHMNETVALAQVAFPVPTFAEQVGTFVNFQGRAQTFEKALEPIGDVVPLKRLLAGLSKPLQKSTDVAAVA